MRLSDLFILVQDLFDGGLAAANKSMRQINESNSSRQRITPQMLWHFWAILGMLAVNYLVIVHVPQWTQIWNQEVKTAPAEVMHIEWSPEVWESQSTSMIHNRDAADRQRSQTIVDVEPVPINLHQIRRRIEIPFHLKTLNSTARIKLRVLVDEKGNYVQHRQPQHLYPDLAQAVNEQASQLSFLPALRNGNPVPYWVEVRFVFEL